MAQQPQFFNPWEPPPTFVPAPADAQLLERISLLVKYATQNGPSFVEMMREKQKADPNFGFLFGGDGYHYWRWALYCTLYNIPVNAPPGPAPGHPAPYPGHQPAYPGAVPGQAPPAAIPGSSITMQLTPEVESGFAQVLEALSGSKVDLMAHPPHASQHCTCMTAPQSCHVR